MDRRQFLGSAAASVAAALAVPCLAAERPAVVKPKRLAAGDTVGLVAPANATFQSLELQIAKESLEALGLKVRIGSHLLDRHGYLAGQDRDRAEDINAFFADASIRAVLPIRGGWAAAAYLPYLDFDTIRRNPKVSPATATSPRCSSHSREDRTGHVPRSERHGAVGASRSSTSSGCSCRGKRSRSRTRAIRDRNALTQIENRTQTITPGKARGRLLGGNLTVLTTILGSPYLPDWDGAIFFCEDVSEESIASIAC